MPLGRSVANKICVSVLELAKTLISKEALKSFQRGVGFLIRWQSMTLSFVSNHAETLATTPVLLVGWARNTWGIFVGTWCLLASMACSQCTREAKRDQSFRC